MSGYDTDGANHHYWSIKVPLTTHDNTNAYVGISTDITEVVRLKDQFQVLANTDALTGISSRRYLLENAEDELKKMHRKNRTMAVVTLDIDHFKTINDNFGHAFGDRIIVAVASACAKNLREIDLFGRVGGDEFVVVLPETNLSATLIVADRLRQAVSEIEVRSDDGAIIYVTSSFGLTISDSITTLDDLLALADSALYKAKLNGRNIVRYELTRRYKNTSKS